VMTFILSLVSIAITPLAIEVMPQIAHRNEQPILSLIVSMLLYIALPLCVGLWLARRTPKVAPRLVLPLEILATVVFLFLMWETHLARREALNAIAGRGTILAMVLLLVASMLIGWFIGGPDRESRRVLATSTGMRSVVVVLYVALLLSRDQCLHDSYHLSVVDGAHQSALSCVVHGVAETASTAQ